MTTAYTPKFQSTRPAKFSRRRRAILPHLGNLFLGSLYHALSSKRHVPRAVFRRAAANGLSREHLEGVARQASSAADVPRLLSAVGESHFQRALYWHDVGVKSRSRDHYLESSLWHLYAAMLSTVPVMRARFFSRTQSSYLLAAPQFVNPAELVAVHHPMGPISAYLRLPTTEVEGDQNAQFIKSNFPCVILFNGLFAAKEELHLMENAFLGTGIATLSFDYPGIDLPSLEAGALAINIEELAGALLLFLSTRSEIDISRVAAFGTSVGGRLALYAAAKLPERFRAIATLSAPLDLLTDLSLLLPAMQRELATSWHCSKAAIFDMARRTPVRPLLPSLAVPLLAVGGTRDIIAMEQETRAIYEEAGSADKKLMICNGAGHNCYEMMPSLRHEIASWIKQRL